jgi:hypothetical protein
LHNFRLTFSVFGPSHVEPAYANIVEEEGSDVHGVAFWSELTFHILFCFGSINDTFL